MSWISKLFKSVKNLFNTQDKIEKLSERIAETSRKVEKHQSRIIRIELLQDYEKRFNELENKFDEIIKEVIKK